MSSRYRERRLADVALAAGAAFGCGDVESFSRSPVRARLGGASAASFAAVAFAILLTTVYFLLR